MVLRGHNRNLTATIRMAFRALMEDINTSLPAIVEMYDPVTGRAMVKPVVQVKVPDEGFLDALPIANVPVMMPHAGGWGHYLTVEEGDLVQLVFSQRGMSAFKRNWENSPPDIVSFFSLHDAVAIVGLGPNMKALNEARTPVIVDDMGEPTGGMALQKEDGTIFMRLDDRGIHVETPMDSTEMDGIILQNPNPDPADSMPPTIFQRLKSRRSSDCFPDGRYGFNRPPEC